MAASLQECEEQLELAAEHLDEASPIRHVPWAFFTQEPGWPPSAPLTDWLTRPGQPPARPIQMCYYYPVCPANPRSSQFKCYCYPVCPANPRPG